MRHTKFKIGTTNMCHCALADMTAEHVLQESPQMTDLQNETWQMHAELRETMYRGVESVKQTDMFLKLSGISV
jgi:hypothetical protein